MPRQRTFRAVKANNDPGHIYEAVDISAADWTPDKGGLFRGLNVDVECDLVVTGTDGNDATLHLVPGFNPAGGQAVVKTGSDTGVTIVAILDAD